MSIRPVQYVSLDRRIAALEALACRQPDCSDGKGVRENAMAEIDLDEVGPGGEGPSSLSDLSFRRNYQIKPGPRLDYYYNTTRRNEAKCQNFPIFP